MDFLDHNLFQKQISSYKAKILIRLIGNYKMKKKLKFLKTEKLNISYFEIGNKNSIPVFLMHGFPYDIYAYKDVV